jgi:acetyltransferase-like isoleucine patch superfamily enzyme
MAVFDDGQAWEQKLLFYPHLIEWREGMPLPSKAASIPQPLEEKEPLREECQHFVDCITTGKTPHTDGREGLRVLRVLDKATQSLHHDISVKEHLKAEVPDLKFPEVFIHESSYVDERVELGSGTKIWHFSHILPDTQIGKNVIIGQNVTVGPHVKIGSNCKIQNNVSIYTGVTLEDGVFCGPSCVFTNVNTPRAEINRKSEFRPTHVGRGVTIGANATIVCGHQLGAYCFIAAGAVVTRDVPPYALMAGVPAKQIGWVSEAGERLETDLVCPRTSQQYCVSTAGVLEKALALNVKT